jgi:hypothetical protein
MFISGSKSTTFLRALPTYPILYPPNKSIQLLKGILKAFMSSQYKKWFIELILVVITF